MKAHFCIWFAVAMMLLCVGCSKSQETNTAADVPAAEAKADEAKADEAKAEETKAEETKIEESALDKQVVQGVVSVHADAMRKCYEAELANNKDLAGKIVYSWEVVADGTVKDVKILDSSMKNEAVESCISKEIESWKFPEPNNGGSARVEYPFEFSASNPDEAKAEDKPAEAKAE